MSGCTDFLSRVVDRVKELIKYKGESYRVCHSIQQKVHQLTSQDSKSLPPSSKLSYSHMKTSQTQPSSGSTTTLKRPNSHERTSFPKEANPNSLQKTKKLYSKRLSSGWENVLPITRS